MVAHVRRGGDAAAHAGGIPALEPVIRGGGYKCLEVLPVAVFYALAHIGGADGTSVHGQARHDAALDAERRQLFAHDLIVTIRDLAEGFLADVAAADAERRGDFAEQREVEFGMADARSVVVGQEVAREGGIADDVRAACMQADVREFRDAGRDELPADGEGEETGVLADEEEMDEIIFAAGPLDEAAVPEREGVGVHDDGGCPAAAVERLFPVLRKAAVSS